MLLGELNKETVIKRHCGGRTSFLVPKSRDYDLEWTVQEFNTSESYPLMFYLRGNNDEIGEAKNEQGM